MSLIQPCPSRICCSFSLWFCSLLDTKAFSDMGGSRGFPVACGGVSHPLVWTPWPRQGTGPALSAAPPPPRCLSSSDSANVRFAQQGDVAEDSRDLAVVAEGQPALSVLGLVGLVGLEPRWVVGAPAAGSPPVSPEAGGAVAQAGDRAGPACGGPGVTVCLRGHLHPADLSGLWAPCGPLARVQLSWAIPGAVATTTRSQGRQQSRAPRCQPLPPELKDLGVPLPLPPSPWLRWRDWPEAPEGARATVRACLEAGRGRDRRAQRGHALLSGWTVACELLTAKFSTCTAPEADISTTQGPWVSRAAQGLVFLPSVSQLGPWALVGPECMGLGALVTAAPT